MKSTDIKIGQRVFVAPHNRIALVVGKPEYYTPRARLVRIKFENSTRFEYKLNHQLDLLPVEYQHKAHGGSHVKPAGDF